jgi:hypothetical protein
VKIIMDPRRFVRHLFVLPLAFVLVGCLGGKKPNTQPTVQTWDLTVGVTSGETPLAAALIEIQDGPNAGVKATTDVSGVALLKGLEQSGFTVCADLTGYERDCKGVTLTASQSTTIALRSLGPAPQPNPEPKPPVPFRGRLTIRGPTFVDAKGAVFEPVFASGLTLLVRSDAERAAFLDWLVATGFNGFRVFAGHLDWAGQTAEGARLLLPSLLEEAQKRGLYVLVTAITDSRPGGYDVREHLRKVAAITRLYENTLLEASNEPYHGTQIDDIQDFDSLCELSARELDGYPYPWAAGAATYDGLVNGRYLTGCGTFSTVHLQRGSEDSQMARMGLLAEIATVHNHPVMNSEPIGADEHARPGSRLDNPDFFGRMGTRTHALRSGGGVFHSEAGVFARVPGPIQQRSAVAFVAGMTGPVEPLPAARPEPCSDVGTKTALGVLECVRYRFSRMNPERTAEMIALAAQEMNRAGVPEGPYGVLIKTAGNQCNGISCDIICVGNGPAQRQFDMLVGSDRFGPQTPTWSEVPKDHMAIRPCEVR